MNFIFRQRSRLGGAIVLSLLFHVLFLVFWDRTDSEFPVQSEDIVQVSFRPGTQASVGQEAAISIPGLDDVIADLQKQAADNPDQPVVTQRVTSTMNKSFDPVETEVPSQMQQTGRENMKLAEAGSLGEAPGYKGEGEQELSGQSGQDIFIAGNSRAVEWGSLIEAYRTTLMAAASKLRRYPPLAKEQGWQGVVFVRARWDGTDSRPVLSIEQVSAYEVLDAQAVVMMEQAVRRFPLPDSLKGHQFSLLFPVEFMIQEY